MMIKIKDMNSLCKTAIVLCFALLGSTNVFAELSLKNTDWSGAFKTMVKEGVSLHFGEDTVLAKTLSGGKVANIMSFTQSGYTVSFFNATDENGCRTTTGSYQIAYEHSGQQLYFKLIRDDCSSRADLLTNSTPLNFIPDQSGAERNWSQLDAATDSIAGIGLDKAYELLRGRNSKQVIVAVIDNGVDLDHEDLKTVIWTNPKEIPGNGIDDDKNGYVDDIHGWNFRGAKDGTTVENEQAGATQIYSIWKNIYENGDSNRLTGEEKKEWGTYVKARKEYLKKINESKDPNDLQFAYNVNYNSSLLIGDNRFDPNERYYGSPRIRLTPNLSHGTHVAGIIAAQRNNQIGIDGIADNVRIMPIVASTAVGDERDKDVANAIHYAVDNGAKVINISFSKTFSPNKKIVDEAVRYAARKNVLIVHCAGNDGVNIDNANNYHFPVAVYENGAKAANFITVGWSRSLFNYRLAHPNSGYGKKNVDVFAPGSDIFSTVPGDGYDFKSGSSMSAPCVSGVAALLLSYFPKLSTAQVKDVILRSSFKPDVVVNMPGTQTKVPFNTLSATGGIVSAFSAVKMVISMTKKLLPIRHAHDRSR